MAVPANPKLSQVCAEFLAPANTKLSQFLRGGAYVPNNSFNTAVPTALPIKLSQLAGATRYVAHSATNSPDVSMESGGRPETLFDTVTCNPVNGVGPFTYAWSHNFGGGGLTISNPTSKTTQISRHVGTGPGDFELNGTLSCVSTDTGSGDNHQITSNTTINWIWVGDM
jgi:hypothetical protein